MYLRRLGVWQERIRDALKKREMTQEDLAIDTDLSQSAISAFLSGRKNPSLDSLIKIVTALDMTMADLFSPSESSFNDQNLDDEFRRVKYEMQQLIRSAEPSQLHSLSLLLAISRKILR